MASGEGQEGGVGEDCGGAGEQGTGPAEGAIQYWGEQRADADDADRGGDCQAVRPAEHVPRQHPLHHLAISIDRGKWEHLRRKLDAAGVEYLHESGTSLYMKDPDGTRIELLADPLGEMYGHKVL